MSSRSSGPSTNRERVVRFLAMPPPEQTAYLSDFEIAILAMHAYQNEAELRAFHEGRDDLRFGRFFEDEGTDSQAFTLYTSDLRNAVLVFRGTESMYDLYRDFRAGIRPNHRRPPSGGGVVVEPFLEPWEALRARFMEWFNATLKPSFEKPVEIIVTGHSLGGAIALIAASDLLASPFTTVVVPTFAAPPAGDKAFVDALLAGRPDGFRSYLDTSDWLMQSVTYTMTMWVHGCAPNPSPETLSGGQGHAARSYAHQLRGPLLVLSPDLDRRRVTELVCALHIGESEGGFGQAGAELARCDLLSRAPSVVGPLMERVGGGERFVAGAVDVYRLAPPATLVGDYGEEMTVSSSLEPRASGVQLAGIELWSNGWLIGFHGLPARQRLARETPVALPTRTWSRGRALAWDTPHPSEDFGTWGLVSYAPLGGTPGLCSGGSFQDDAKRGRGLVNFRLSYTVDGRRQWGDWISNDADGGVRREYVGPQDAFITHIWLAINAPAYSIVDIKYRYSNGEESDWLAGSTQRSRVIGIAGPLGYGLASMQGRSLSRYGIVSIRFCFLREGSGEPSFVDADAFATF